MPTAEQRPCLSHPVGESAAIRGTGPARGSGTIDRASAVCTRGTLAAPGSTGSDRLIDQDSTALERDVRGRSDRAARRARRRTTPAPNTSKTWLSVRRACVLAHVEDPRVDLLRARRCHATERVEHHLRVRVTAHRDRLPGSRRSPSGFPSMRSPSASFVPAILHRTEPAVPAGQCCSRAGVRIARRHRRRTTPRPSSGQVAS